LPLDARGLLGAVPVAAWVCALVALLNGVAWSILTPPFQGRDEPAHFAYVQQLAETETLPHESSSGGLSPEEALVMEGLNWSEVSFSPQTLAISSMSEQSALTRDLNGGSSTVGSGEAGVATSEPPVYYALQSVPYAIGAGNLLIQLELMRLTGALLAAITALLTFFFLRELLPGVSWAATAGALCVSVQPLFGFMSGTLNPDNLLYAVSAAVLLCLARAFRRGLTRGLAIATGVLIALGFLTKLNFAGLAFGVFAGLALLAVREARSRGRKALLSPAIAATIGASPVLAYALVNALSGHPLLGSGALFTRIFTGGALFREFSYVWELYLPRLPGMTQSFAGLTTFKDIWFDRSVGLYGWIDTELPGWVENVALVVVGAIALLCIRTLVVRRAALRARIGELAVYTAIILGVLTMVGLASYFNRASTGGVEGFGDPRYLLPMLPLLGAVLTLAIRGAGRRWSPATGAVLIVLFLAHDIASQLQVIARYYG
jgi:4-amino-4-deoxy-L-arabinose transferase-like glycosyltransferase